MSLVFAALAAAVCMVVVVQRAKKTLDFAFTLYFVHTLLCWAVDTFPTNATWWMVHVLAFIITAALGEYLCMRRELEDINIDDLLANRRKRTVPRGAAAHRLAAADSGDGAATAAAATAAATDGAAGARGAGIGLSITSAASDGVAAGGAKASDRGGAREGAGAAATGNFSEVARDSAIRARQEQQHFYEQAAADGALTGKPPVAPASIDGAAGTRTSTASRAGLSFVRRGSGSGTFADTALDGMDLLEAGLAAPARGIFSVSRWTGPRGYEAVPSTEPPLHAGPGRGSRTPSIGTGGDTAAIRSRGSSVTSNDPLTVASPAWAVHMPPARYGPGTVRTLVHQRDGTWQAADAGALSPPPSPSSATTVTSIHFPSDALDQAHMPVLTKRLQHAGGGGLAARRVVPVTRAAAEAAAATNTRRIAGISASRSMASIREDGDESGAGINLSTGAGASAGATGAGTSSGAGLRGGDGGDSSSLGASGASDSAPFATPRGKSKANAPGFGLGHAFAFAVALFGAGNASASGVSGTSSGTAASNLPPMRDTKRESSDA